MIRPPFTAVEPPNKRFHGHNSIMNMSCVPHTKGLGRRQVWDRSCGCTSGAAGRLVKQLVGRHTISGHYITGQISAIIIIIIRSILSVHWFTSLLGAIYYKLPRLLCRPRQKAAVCVKKTRSSEPTSQHNCLSAPPVLAERMKSTMASTHSSCGASLLLVACVGAFFVASTS